MVWGYRLFFELELGLGEVRVGLLVGIVRRRRRGGYVMDKVEVFVGGVGRMMSVSCFFKAYVWQHTHTARGAVIFNKDMSLPGLLHLHDAQVRKAWICMRSDWSTWKRGIEG